MTKNLTNFNEFQNKRKGINESKNGEKINEMFVGDVMRQNPIVDVPVSLIKAFITKVKSETGQDVNMTWSNETVANEIIKYVFSNFMNIENLPVSILVGDKSQGPVQTQGQPVQSQGQPVQSQGQPQQGQGQGQPIQPSPQSQQVPPATQQTPQQTAQTIPPTES